MATKLIIEFRAKFTAELWQQFYPPVSDPKGWVEDRNAEYGWEKYRTRRVQVK